MTLISSDEPPDPSASADRSVANPTGGDRSRFVPLAILAFLLAYYLAIFLHYRPYDIDNPWFLSFSYNLCVEHVQSDQFMDVQFPGGMDGTQYFGKLAASTQCAFAGGQGWQQWPAVVLSSVLVVFSLATWWLLLRRLDFSSRFISCFLFVVGISEPFLYSANKFRYEPFAFGLVSLGLLAVVSGWPFAGAFLAALAVETEPAALAAVLPVLILAWFTYGISRSLTLRLGAGGALAAAVYLVLHPAIFQITGHMHQAASPGHLFDGGFLAAYFFGHQLRQAHLRHLPELFCLFFAAVVYWNRRSAIASHFLGVAALTISVFSFLMPHGNLAYTIFAYPFLVGMTLTAFQADRRPWLIAACMVAYVAPQQLYLLHLTRNLGYRSSDIAAVSSAITDVARKLNMPDQTLRVYGDYRLYFAHPHLYRAAADSTRLVLPQADLYLCFDSPPQPLPLEPPSLLYCPDIKKIVPLQHLATVELRGYPVFLYAAK